MDFNLLLKVGGVLALLGFFTNCFASLVVCFCIADRAASIIFAILLLIVAVAYILLGISADKENASRPFYFFTGAISAFSGIIYFFVSNQWNVNASYLNHFVIYLLPLVSISCALSLQWNLVTSYVFQDVLDANHVGGGKEQVIYCVVCILSAFFSALCIPSTNKTTNDGRCGAGIVNSIGIWFLSGIFAFLIGLKFVLHRGDAPLSQAPAAAAVYDQVA